MIYFKTREWEATVVKPNLGNDVNHNNVLTVHSAEINTEFLWEVSLVQLAIFVYVNVVVRPSASVVRSPSSSVSRPSSVVSCRRPSDTRPSSVRHPSTVVRRPCVIRPLSVVVYRRIGKI